MVGVVDGDSKVNMRPVKMGERSGAMWQVLEGLKAGEKVVVQGHHEGSSRYACYGERVDAAARAARF